MILGFNPMPNLSLGDIESIFDIENEIIALNDIVNKPPSSDKEKAIKQFNLIDIPEKDIVYTDSSCSLGRSIAINTGNDIKDVLIEIDGQECDLGNTDAHIEEERELLERIRKAEEARKSDEERLNNIQKLKEEAERAEQEAAIAREKRELEQLRVEEEKRLKELKQLELAQKQEVDRLRAQMEAELASERQRIEKEKIELKYMEEKLKMRQELEQFKQAEREKLQKAEAEALAEARKKAEAEALAEAKKREQIKKLLLEKKRKEQLENAKTVKEKAVKRVIEENRQLESCKPVDSSEIYNSLDIDALYSEVRKFLKSKNIDKKVIDIAILESKFGKDNIRKLLLKSYLISIGKGVTVGK